MSLISKFIFALFFLPVINIHVNEAIPQSQRETILKPSKFNKPLLSVIPVDLTPYNLSPRSGRISGAEQTFCADSLLMWEKEEQYYAADYKILLREIPLKKMEPVYCTVTRSLSRQNSLDSISSVKSYLIIVNEAIKDTTYSYIATIFPEYNSTDFNDHITFLEKANFSGIIIYSDKSGDFLEVEHYKKGRIWNGKLSLPGEESNAKTQYLTVYRGLKNRSGRKEKLMPLVVVKSHLLPDRWDR